MEDRRVKAFSNRASVTNSSLSQTRGQQSGSKRSQGSAFEEGLREEEDSEVSDGSDEAHHQSGADAPRVAQWEPESDPGPPDRAADGNKGEEPLRTRLGGVNGNLRSLSFGSLLKARRVLVQALVHSTSDDPDSESGESPSDEPETREDSRPRMERERTQDEHVFKKPEKRAHKHAPVEMTSKRPITRRRQVIEVKKVTYRDPRFSELTGELNSATFQRRYSFIADMHKTELSTLKENLKRAKDMLRSSPRDQREAREEEVQRLERAVKRAESSVNRDRREDVEREALVKVRMEERQRRKEGKGDWYMKNTVKKEFLLRARHDALAETGGRLAVRKAIEKRQKKINQKEKKRRPSFLGRATNGGGDKRRKIV